VDKIGLVYNRSGENHTAPYIRMEPMTQKRLRILIAKPGLDGHDRGAKVIARALRDAGMEVIYTGLRQTPEMIAEAALQEDVDAVGVSVLSGAHMALVPRLIELLQAQGQGDVPLLIGGIIPSEDAPRLMEMGLAGVFGPGTSTEVIIEAFQQAVSAAANKD
jgi:methylmalonyl-CoA mutase C-terminal domain/subunit